MAASHAKNNTRTMSDAAADIQRFYHAKSVLVTGGTGSLGRLTIERLLVCGARRIYMLVRPKKGMTIAQRFDKFIASPVFENVKANEPNFHERIVPMHGDCLQPNLEMESSDMERLIDEVNVIIHCAAVINFDVNLQVAGYGNVRATKDLLTLARQAKHFQMFVYVSTAFSNAPLQSIEEKFYKPSISGDRLLRILDSKSLDEIIELTPKLTGNWPNNYSFTKSIAEDVVREHAHHLPAVVVRPSMILPTFKQPIPGWIENFYGPIGITCGVMAGLIRVVNARPDNYVDVVPADYVVNAILAAGWKEAEDFNRRRECNKDVAIYNMVSTPQAKIKFYDFTHMLMAVGHKHPLTNTIWRMMLLMIPDPRWFKFVELFLHTIPAYCLDFVYKNVMGKKPM